MKIFEYHIFYFLSARKSKYKITNIKRKVNGQNGYRLFLSHVYYVCNSVVHYGSVVLKEFFYAFNTQCDFHIMLPEKECITDNKVRQH